MTELKLPDHLRFRQERKMVQLIEGDKEVAADKDEIEPIVAHDVVG